MRRPLSDALDPASGEALRLLGELGEFARQSMPAQAERERETAATLPPVLAPDAAPAPRYASTRPEYQPALQDSSLIEALLSLLPPPASPKKSPAPAKPNPAPAVSSPGFQSARPPNFHTSAQTQPKRLGARHTAGTQSVFVTQAERPPEWPSRSRKPS